MGEQHILAVKNEDFEVKFDLLKISDPQREEITAGLACVEERIAKNQQKIDALNREIDRLTNKADCFDYSLAACSGILTGIVDSFLVGEFSLTQGREWGAETANRFVVKVAQGTGFGGNTITEAIPYLERYHLASDSVTSDFGGGLQHHLRDFTHHPTPVGLAFSMLTQFTGNAYGTDTSGAFIVVPIRNRDFIGKDFPQKILYGFVYWIFHMVSDMAGSKSTPGAGTGLPGPLLSLLKEMSALPFFKKAKVNDVDLSVWLSKLFNGTQLAKRDMWGRITEKTQFDLRTELGIAHELGRQAIPVIINECIVRGMYFVRRLAIELRQKRVNSVKQLNKIDWNAVLPFKNRTIIRMLTVAHGTFSAVDLADAAVRSAAKTGGITAPTFLANFALRINFVGIGRFVVALGTDISMGIQRSKLENEKIEMCMEQLHLHNAKVSYIQADMWISAREARYVLDKVRRCADEAARKSLEDREVILCDVSEIDFRNLNQNVKNFLMEAWEL